MALLEEAHLAYERARPFFPPPSAQPPPPQDHRAWEEFELEKVALSTVAVDSGGTTALGSTSTGT
jgi:hypothetical protein